MIRPALSRFIWEVGLCRRASSSSSIEASLSSSSSSSQQWQSSLSAAAALTSYPRVPEKLRMLLLEDADLVNWQERMSEVERGRHPLGSQVRRLFRDDRDALQMRGVLSLLLARCLNPAAASPELRDQVHQQQAESGEWILPRQKSLAEQVEMISVAQDMHETIVNLPKDLHKDRQGDDKARWLLLEEGNKSALLGGDLLLAQASVGLAQIRNTYVVEIVSMAITDHMAAKFIGRRDVQGRFIPGKDDLTEDSWNKMSSLTFGNLMSAACRSVSMLADMSEEIQDLCHLFGHHLALALKSYSELKGIVCGGDTKTRSSSTPPDLDLGSAPVLFHLREDPALLDYVVQCEGRDLDSVDFDLIRSAVSSSSSSSSARELCRFHSEESSRIFADLLSRASASRLTRYEPEGEARMAMEAVIRCLKSGP